MFTASVANNTIFIRVDTIGVGERIWGGMKALILDGEIGMRGKDVDNGAVCDQIAMKYKTPHQKAWLVEIHNALVRSALQRAEVQAINGSLCISFNAVLGLVMFMHDALICISSHTPHQALLGRQPHALPPFECGCHGGLGVKGAGRFSSRQGDRRCSHNRSHGQTTISSRR